MIGNEIIKIVSENYLKIDPACLISLTDINNLIAIDNQNISPCSSDEKSSRDFYSSSVLRICCYNPLNTVNKDEKVAFGAHTDTTFLTVAPCSSVPGLEIYHNKLKVDI